MPQYQKIAVDLASKIVDGKYKVGDKIYARSALASRYGVSSETARRAVCVLADLDIVESTKGSGVIIKSQENAVNFTKRYRGTQTLNDIKQKMLDSVERQLKEIEEFSHCLSELMERTERYRSANPFMPFQIKIPENSRIIGKSAGEMKFWQNTGATIVAIRHAGELKLSPGPYANFQAEDILYFIGNDESMEKVKVFINKKKKSGYIMHELV